jgi:hypothetical protein
MLTVAPTELSTSNPGAEITDPDWLYNCGGRILIKRLSFKLGI